MLIQLNLHYLPAKSLFVWILQGIDSKMIIQIQPLPICSRCAKHELASWITENVNSLDPDVAMKTREEFKSVRLRDGECIVCNSHNVSDNFFESVLKIFEKSKVNPEILDQYKRSFFFCDYSQN